MILGLHLLHFSTDADADRAFLRDVLGWRSVEAGPPGHAWPIFAAPPAELAVHPAESASTGLYLMCDDVEATRRALHDRGVATAEVTDEGWGLVTSVTLPSGAEVGLYEPRHPSPLLP